MIQVNCNICDTRIELPDGTAEGKRFTCPTCFAQLSLKKLKGKLVAACAMCKKIVMECEVCDEREAIRVEKDLI